MAEARYHAQSVESLDAGNALIKEKRLARFYTVVVELRGEHTVVWADKLEYLHDFPGMTGAIKRLARGMLRRQGRCYSPSY